MGNTSSSSSSGHKQLVNQAEPLTFHSVHSEHIRLFNDDKISRRVESFCKGICFSARPINVGELVSIRCSDISTNWSGFLRVGFTAHNPSTLNPHTLPRYACPDMTNQPGNWAKALPERFGIVNNVITYSVNRQGDVHIALNGESVPGPFFCGVNISAPLWVLIDIYGNATGVEFLDKGAHISTSPMSRSSSMVASSPDQHVSRRSRKNTAGSLTPPTSIPITTGSLHHPRVVFLPLHFHSTTGKCVSLNSEKTVATRHVAEYANAYVFCERPINILEKIVIQVVGMDMSYSGGLTVGMTSCDPASILSQELPDDSDQLLDRPEYWVVHKDVVTAAEVGDELSFTMSIDGEIQFSRNSHPPVVIMHVDKSIPMWIFWDLYGQFNQIKLFGVVGSIKAKTRSPPAPPPPAAKISQRAPSLLDTPSPAPTSPLIVELPSFNSLNIAGAPPIPPRLQRSNTVGASSSSPSFTTDSKTGAAAAAAEPDIDEAADNMANECTFCFDKPCDCVIYTCGHMCMCYECAMNVKSSADPLCPICRQDIKDIIRIYKS